LYDDCDADPLTCEKDVSADDNNCGACDNACSVNATCGTGQCNVQYGEDVEFAGTSDITTGYFAGDMIYVATDMVVTDLALIGKEAGTNVKLALYEDNAAAPDALVVNTAATPVVVGAMNIPVTETAIAAGNYWIMAGFDGSGKVGMTTQDNPIYRWRALPWADPIPDPCGLTTATAGRRYNFYVVGYEQ
jgi:hypothetical protein